ncbi:MULTISPECIES: HAD family hydrolase [unclassified Herbaspirillum]|uniref:HAD family hydrolase n=1 Tax=unclassified Herbaspirillum TaxID=2624150 RepID=UPI0011528751|nr:MULTISPECIES: HAD family hydrolase [unclassified Herbaspirillum]MBB5392434.1 putative hydrolase of the HAD superfamily [Herbaspirillum sp. SJZ102]TQK06073.1 putative hydrolase of the HAD superfamily [Herbaspirillum sp. SJZ130]TQK12449.1 putative hydrolase of the HAD superfamily [Herbaspirillum sp. SJZ106]
MNTPPSSASRAAVKAVLFDLDDTLWAIEPVLVRAEGLLYEWLRRHAPKVTARHSVASLRERRMALMQTDPLYRIDLWKLRHAALTEVLREHGEDPALADEAMALFSEARSTVALFDDVEPALQRLKARLTLGTVSNGFADLERIGLASHFGVSIAAHRFGRAKPDAAIFHAACDALGVAPAETVYVGDDLQLDVQGAQQAGLRAVWMNRFGRDLPAGIAPDAICRDLHELHAWLDAQAASQA